MTLIIEYQNRGRTRDVTINDAAGNAITPHGNDHIRAEIGREGETPRKLSVSSEPGGGTANGSTFTKGGGGTPTSHRLRLDAADLNFPPGVYMMFLDYFDAADANEWKTVDRQCFVLMGT
jgi:hypothetical protein